MKWLGLRARIMLALVLVVAAACGALTVATTHWVAENRDQQLMREMEWASSLDSDWLLTAVERNPGARRLTDLGGDRPSAGDEPGEAALIPLASPEVDVQLAEQYVFRADVPLNKRVPECLAPHGLEDSHMTSGGYATWSTSCGNNLVTYGLVLAQDGAAMPRWLVVRVLDLTTIDDPVPALAGTLITYSVLIVIVGLALAGFLAAMVANPLTKARAMAESVAAGQMEVRLPVVGRDEVAGMSAAVNTMADRLTAQISDLEQSNQTQRRFVSDVAHELRTPTAALLASAEALEHPQTRDRAAVLVVPQLRRLATLTEDLLEISRIDAGRAHIQSTRIDLMDLTNEIIDDCGSPESVQLVGSFPLEVTTDPTRLRVILRNLVANALQHGGPPVTVTADRSNGRLRLSVTDQGQGVPPGLRDHIFDRFVRGDAARHGTSSGLGLAIAAENARLLGGTLTIDNDRKTFLVTLPD